MDMFSLGHSNQLIDNEYNREPGLECGSEEASQVVSELVEVGEMTESQCRNKDTGF